VDDEATEYLDRIENREVYVLCKEDMARLQALARHAVELASDPFCPDPDHFYKCKCDYRKAQESYQATVKDLPK